MEPEPVVTFKRPDITPAQIVAFLAAGITLAASFGFELSDEQTNALLAFVGFCATFILGDSIIRNGRSKIAAAEVNAAATQPIVQVVPGGSNDGDDSQLGEGAHGHAPRGQ